MAKIYRYTVVIDALAYSPAPRCVIGIHVQTDVPVAGTEPTAAYILNELDQHFSTSGTNLLKIREMMDTGSNVARTQLYERVADEGIDVPLVASTEYALAGTTSLTDDRMPAPACPWFKNVTGVGIRAARGGTHGPPIPNASF